MTSITDKKLEIYEDDDSLEISFKWFSPMAFFLLFFSIFWVGFLVFWYAISFSTGAPLMAILFPLIHVGVGVGLVYYVLCLFFNKTYFHIHDGELNVIHQPIPWWKGNRKMNIEDISQFYVKEKKSSSKNGTNYTYDLRAKLRNNEDKSIMAIDNISSQTAMELEKRLEKFLGIQDQPVKGEYQSIGSQKEPQFKLARKHFKKNINATFSDLYFAESNNEIHFEGTPLKVAAIAQYDWHNGNTDKLLQLLDDQQVETIIYIKQQKAILKAFQEQDLIQGKMPITFNQSAPAKTIEIDGITFFLEQSYMGESFFSFTTGHSETKQWLYFSEDQQQYLRIQEQKGQLSYSKGRQLSADDFNAPLDLNKMPEIQKPNPQARDWENGDFV
ncbi:MAG: hypothetical protein Sapg2KO_30930 [Saprospiraceae bacterium]